MSATRTFGGLMAMMGLWSVLVVLSAVGFWTVLLTTPALAGV